MRKPGKFDLTQSLRLGSFAMIALFIALYAYFLYTSDIQTITQTIRALGFPGSIAGILIQTATNILPVPGGFISIMLLEIYGPVWGGIFTWIGGMLGAIGAMYVTRWMAKPFARGDSGPFLTKVNALVKTRGDIGLLIIRFVPLVPYHFVNYASGLLEVRIWPFIWTTALGILPYTVAISGLYAGIRQGSLNWGIGGAALFGLLALLSWYAKRTGSARLERRHTAEEAKL